MSMNESIIIFNNQPIQNIFNQYQIQLNYYLDKMCVKIENNCNIYESFYTLKYHQNYTIEEMIEFINAINSSSFVLI